MRFDFKSLALKYAAVVVMPLALLLYTPAVNFSILVFGTRVLLETVPVDPTDFLRGDYVTLDYEILRISSEMLPESSETVYVTLSLNQEGVASMKKVSVTRPLENELYLKGVVSRRWGSRFVDCGLGAYYVPEGTGWDLERAIQNHRVMADVRVLRGRAVISSLIVGPELTD
ncbi:MAG: GDYXXLXY domain-containing protein [Synergistaceae bacterium]|jgi:uncharacterized membrane-anchored protein|nr:GDYXXLXY domain-containing protein [Synergistaceae bacterium]